VISASALIHAPASRVYAILADYERHHPRILPRDFFRKLEVESGGIGAGTRTRIEMRVLGSTRIVRHVISEPEPGRVLVETDLDGASITTFTVDPVDDGEACNVAIDTELRSRPALLGRVERWIAARILPRIYRQELALLAGYAMAVESEAR
jgi:hypothetical protein